MTGGGFFDVVPNFTFYILHFTFAPCTGRGQGCLPARRSALAETVLRARFVRTVHFDFCGKKACECRTMLSITSGHK